jgi:hypothetical protein
MAPRCAALFLVVATLLLSAAGQRVWLFDQAAFGTYHNLASPCLPTAALAADEEGRAQQQVGRSGVLPRRLGALWAAACRRCRAGVLPSSGLCLQSG